MPKTVLVVLAAALVPALGLAHGGYQPDAWVWSGALAAWAAALALTLTGSTGMLASARWWVASACALLLWTLASALWSARPGQSLLDARRLAVYTAFVLALTVLARRRPTAALVAATHAAVSLLVVYSLGRYLLGGRNHDPFEAWLLSSPVGYANAVGILAVLGVLLSLAAVTAEPVVARRAAAAATIPLLVLALELTQSRASVLALLVGAAATLLLHPRPRAVALAAAAQVLPAAAAFALGAYSRLATDPVPRLSGPTLAAGVACCAAAAAAAAVPRRRTTAGRQFGRRAVAVAGVAVLAGAVVAASALSTEPRRDYYGVAWHEYRTHPLLGGGAATFGHYWLRWGDPARWSGALDAHSLYLETLAELGPVGLLLLLVFLFQPLVRAPARRDVPGVPFAAGAAVAFLTHAGLDWDWEMPVVVLVGLTTLAAVAFAVPDGEPRPAPRWARTAALVLALALGAASIAAARSKTDPEADKTSWAPHCGAQLQSYRDGRRTLLVVPVAVPVTAA